MATNLWFFFPFEIWTGSFSSYQSSFIKPFKNWTHFPVFKLLKQDGCQNTMGNIQNKKPDQSSTDCRFKNTFKLGHLISKKIILCVKQSRLVGVPLDQIIIFLDGSYKMCLLSECAVFRCPGPYSLRPFKYQNSLVLGSQQYFTFHKTE